MHHSSEFAGTAEEKEHNELAADEEHENEEEREALEEAKES